MNENYALLSTIIVYFVIKNVRNVFILNGWFVFVDESPKYLNDLRLNNSLLTVNAITSSKLGLFQTIR